MSSGDVRIGDVVKVEQGLGVVKYIGEVQFAEGVYVGIELHDEDEEIGDHQGW